MNSKVDKPYPEPKVVNKNLQYANLLLQEYSGVVSENSVIHLYLYQHFVLKEHYPEISKILKSIAITEMKHLELLGETITLLGMKPIYATMQNGLAHFWDSSKLNYSITLREILEMDIISEHQAIQNYQNSKRQIQDIYIQSMLQRIIEDEELHLNTFKNLLHTNFPKIE